MEKKKPIDWSKRAKTLSQYGYKFRGRIGPETKKQIRTAWNKHGNWLHTKTPDRVVFTKGTPKKSLIFTGQTTPTGFFTKRPKNVSKSEYNVTVSKDGAIKFRIKRRTEVIVPLRKKGLADDPRAEIRRAVGSRRPVKVRMFINGYDGHRMFSVEEFGYYMSELLLPELSGKGPDIKLKLIYHDKKTIRHVKHKTAPVQSRSKRKK